MKKSCTFQSDNGAYVFHDILSISIVKTATSTTTHITLLSKPFLDRMTLGGVIAPIVTHK